MLVASPARPRFPARARGRTLPVARPTRSRLAAAKGLPGVLAGNRRPLLTGAPLRSVAPRLLAVPQARPSLPARDERPILLPARWVPPGQGQGTAARPRGEWAAAPAGCPTPASCYTLAGCPTRSAPAGRLCAVASATGTARGRPATGFRARQKAATPPTGNRTSSGKSDTPAQLSATDDTGRTGAGARDDVASC